MAPLNTEGYSFPCKGFPKGPVTHTFDSLDVSVTLEGTVTHGGGHCQFGISFDDSTFIVLKTVIRNCLLDGMSFQFSLPSTLPKNQFTLFWTWVNAIGNREYYMECADVALKSNPNIGQVSNGNELVVVNLPGYSTIPEFPLPGMYDGRELFSTKNTPIQTSTQISTLIPIQTSTLEPIQTSIQTSIQISTLTSTQTSTLIPIQTSNTRTKTHQIKTKTRKQFTILPISDKGVFCTTNGKMKCDESGGFQTCDHNKWVLRKCAVGTKCKPFQDYIICDYM